MKRHPIETQKLLQSRDQRRKEFEDRILRNPKIAQALKRDQRKKEEPQPAPAPSRHVA